MNENAENPMKKEFEKLKQNKKKKTNGGHSNNQSMVNKTDMKKMQ